MFATLLLPRFGLQAALRSDSAQGRGPAALVEEEGHKARVREACEAARAEGVEIGMSAAQAQACSPRLRFLSRNRKEEEALRRLLREAAYACSGQVEESAPGLCLLDLRRHPRFRKGGRGAGNSALSDPTALPARFRALGLTLQVGIGPTPALAHWAARVARPCRVIGKGEEIAGELSIEEAAPAELASLLRLWGVTTPAELAALPKEGLTERLGREGLILWERIHGKEDEPLRLLRPEEPFEAGEEWERPVEELGPLRTALGACLRRLGERLEREGKAAASLGLTLLPEGQPAQEYSFAIPTPTAEPRKLLELVDPFLENHRTSSPLTGFRFRIDPVPPPWHQPTLERGAVPDPSRLSATLGRLSALLGEGRVGVPCPSPDHRPEGFGWKPFDPWLCPDACPPPGLPLLGAPLRRFRPPIRATVRCGRGRPEELQTPEGTRRIAGAAGPYPLSGSWWEEAWRRQEWDVALSDGRLLRLAELPEGWQIEGEYG